MTRKALRQRGEAMKESLGLAPEGDPVPGFDDFMSETVYGSVWARPNLPLEDRFLSALAALCALERTDELKEMVSAALRTDLTPRNILEVFMQTGLYAGFGTTRSAAALAREVFAEEGESVPDDPPANDDNETLDRQASSIMDEMHGERGRIGYAAPDNPVTGALYATAVRYGYGDLWFRPGLDRRQRMVCALAAFTVLGLASQVGKFGESALNVGLSREEIIEAIGQTAPYGGFPRALNALAILNEKF